MKPHIRFRTYCLLFAFVLLFSVAAGAQQKSASTAAHGRVFAYDVTRESALEAVVLEYNANSSTAPFGARALLQTSAGTVDAHLGNSKVLEANHISLSAGHSVPALAENLIFSTVTIFAVRTLQ